MEGTTCLKKEKRRCFNGQGLVDLILSWSVEDILNDSLYANQVDNIPESFQSVEDYLSSFVFPLLEETRAELCSCLEVIYTAPFAEVISFDACNPCGSLLYDFKVDYWRNRFSGRGREPYRTLPGDIFLIADAKPETVSDLYMYGRTYTFASVTKITDDEDEDGGTCTYFKVRASKDATFMDDKRRSLYAIFLVNMTTNMRIWSSLRMQKNLSIIKGVLHSNFEVSGDCNKCSLGNSILGGKLNLLLTKLNESQKEAVFSCLHKIQCYHKSSVELIWGPPGTGKTRTVGTLLFTLLEMKCRILVCAPTNVAVAEVASCVLQLMESSGTNMGVGGSNYPLGNILLFGNKDRLKVGSDIKEIYLDYRVEKLSEMLGPLTGWRHCFSSMIDFLKNCALQYHTYVDNELINRKELDENGCRKRHCKSFLEYLRERCLCTLSPLKKCLLIFSTHVPMIITLEHNYKKMVSLSELLDSFQALLFQSNLVSEELVEVFSHTEEVKISSHSITEASFQMFTKRSECLHLLKVLQCSLGELGLPNAMSKGSIKEFCFQVASLVFCTASSAYKLHSIEMEPLDLLVIDEAAQLKECESTIPLQVKGIRHAILIGDECQLPAMVSSNLAHEAGFARSLFGRLSLMGHSRHLLNMQYRMHPSISCFPNLVFYQNKILDAPVVKSESYEQNYLPGPLFGPYSFINIFGGRDEVDDNGHSRKNMVEAVAVQKIVHKLHKAWNGLEKKLSIGVISPYAAQVSALQEKLARKYDNLDGFMVKVNTVDGFQGGEEDIIIISTVRSNSTGLIGFLSNPQRTNVALTRARHCLWILGNGRTLAKSESVWASVVCDAKDRHCYYNADDDKDLAKAIIDVKKELDQLDDLLNGESALFRSARWKVLFSDDFKKSFRKLTPKKTKASVMNLLLKLSTGWRPKKRNVDTMCESSLHILKQFKVEYLYVVCSVDIVKESMHIHQVLKVWDVLPLEDISKLVKRLDNIFKTYTDDFISKCEEKSLEGDLEVPKSWATGFDFARFKDINDNEASNNLSVGAVDGRNYVENSKVSESLLLMKFYSLSSGTVQHLLSDPDGRELDLPFEVTDEEREIISFDKSTFILGRSGTGKTTVLTMKLFQMEKQHQQAIDAFYGKNRNTSVHVCHLGKVMDETEDDIVPTLRQLFVTVSPKLCHAVKQQVSQFKSFASGIKPSVETNTINVDAIDDMERFSDVPDSFRDLPATSYPLVITFHKFLMMLDGTLGNSYFDRFRVIDVPICEKIGKSRSLVLQNLMRREVNFERFCSCYWPHFDTHLTKKFDSSQVFTEIISHIKGGLQAGAACDGKLCREDYVNLSEFRFSSLNKNKREVIYDIFQAYEKMKIEKRDFDLADLVIDLHKRLRFQPFEGDNIDFVYIDEVQDLTMRQIALFKYVCRNVVEGFVFSGDTAQTIARGVDFRFQDIRSLFYNEFMLESVSEDNVGRKDKGHISKIFHLCQNFRTHAGVLNLAQSVIDLLYKFFRHSIDVLRPETSLIYGETPVLLESGNDENAIVTIFGHSGTVEKEVTGFGAEQVILVRDSHAREEISRYVGKQALVLTIVECKGLEFQDVLLYNFFGTSPLKNQWRVIYNFMEEQGLFDATLSKSFPSFNEAKHNLLCSELKQLYVAITRTRQRLWICENLEEFSKPMFDYWMKLCVVQVRQLDESLAQAMQVASSPEEWRVRGQKLLLEKNFEMATMCFERAGDKYLENFAKAAGLKAAADRVQFSNSEMARSWRREAADLFESIGKADHAAGCFYDLEEFERAGKLYLEKCGYSKLEAAGECFYRAGHYKQAAEVYARGSYFSECLSVCTEGKLFDMGLQYIQYWKQHATLANGFVKNDMEINRIEQKFLEDSALYYHGLKDEKTMMKFVKAFHCTDSIRNFLRNLGCTDELLLWEEEAGNYLEAAMLAKQKGDFLREADLHGKGGRFEEASLGVIWYVFATSLWTGGSTGWPLKKFAQKEELLEKAKVLAREKEKPGLFYEAVCTESDILSNEQNCLSELMQYLSASRKYESLRGEVLCMRKILDVHLRTSASKYEWEDDLVVDMVEHAQTRISSNHVSIETLVFFWNSWKENIAKIFEYLGLMETSDHNEYGRHREFCLNYLGLWKQYKNLNPIYYLLNPDSSWVREDDRKFFRKDGNLCSIDAHQLVLAARRHWWSEMLSVGMEVLATLKALHNFSLRNSLSLFCHTMSLAHIFDISKFLLEFKVLGLRYCDEKALREYLGLSAFNFFKYIFPMDWRKSLVENMISLRGSDYPQRLLREVILEASSPKIMFSYGQIGHLVKLIFGCARTSCELYEKILPRLDKNSSWGSLLENLSGAIQTDTQGAPAPTVLNNISGEFSFVCGLHRALQETFNVNWRNVRDYISPDCFLYLIERFLILVFCFHGYLFTTKSSFLEWMIFQKWTTSLSPPLPDGTHFQLGIMLDDVAKIIEQFIYNKNETADWIKKSGNNLNTYYPLMVLRLVVILCLLCVNSGRYYPLLFNLHGRKDITCQLPYDFCYSLKLFQRYRPTLININMVAEAFAKIGNPLLVVNWRTNCHKFESPHSVYVDLNASRGREEILNVLFPKKIQEPPCVLQPENITSDRSSERVASSQENVDLQKSFGNVWECLDALLPVESTKDVGGTKIISVAPIIKAELKKNEDLIAAAMAQLDGKSTSDGQNETLIQETKTTLDDMKQLSYSLGVSGKDETNRAAITEQVRRMQLRRPKLEDFFTKLLSHNEESVDSVPQIPEESSPAAGASVIIPQSNPGKGKKGNTKNKKHQKSKGKRK